MKMKKWALICLLSACLTLSACGGGDDGPAADAGSATYISDMEARIFFYEITSVYRYELMTMSAEELKNGVDPRYWQGCATEVSELSFEELGGEYINEEEKNLLGTAYGATVANMRFGIYDIGDLQAGIDYLFGVGKYDVSAWNHNNVDIVNNNIFGTSAGYFLFAKSDDKRFDNQIYRVVSVQGGEGKATILARAVSVDTITDKCAQDLSVVETYADDNGDEYEAYRYIDGADVDRFGLNTDFDTNLKNMGIRQGDLGTTEFTFGVDGISVYLESAIRQ